MINEEQAETVRMIFNLYLHENGSMKIAKILTEQKKTLRELFIGVFLTQCVL